MDTDSISRQQEEPDTTGDNGENNGGGEEEKDHELYDSLEVPALTQEKGESRGISKILPMQQNKVHKISRLGHQADKYADLRYDPNWKLNFEQLYNDRNQSRYLLFREVSEEGLCSEEGDAAGRETEKQRNISRVPAVTFSPGTSEQRWELSSEMPPTLYHPPWQEHTVNRTELRGSEHRSPRLAPEGAPDRNHSHEQLVKAHERFDGTDGSSAGQRQFSEQKYAHDSKTFKNKQENAGRKVKPLHLLSMAKEARAKRDIVERNKVTLGMNTQKQGSYLWTHENKGEKGYTKKNESETREKVSSADSLEDGDEALDAEQRWQRRTQKLKLAQGCNAKKGQKAERNNHSQAQDRRQNLPRSLAHEDRNSKRVSPVSGTSQWSKASAPDLQPNRLFGRQGTPTVNLNINLNTPSDVMPFLDQRAAEHSVSTSHNPLLRARPPGIYHLPTVGPHLNLWLAPSQVVPYYNPRLAQQIPALPSSDPGADQHNLERQNFRGGHSGRLLLPDQGNPSFGSMDPTKARGLPAKWQHAAEKIVYQDLGNQCIMQQYESCLLSPGLTPPSSRLYQVLPPIGQTAGSSAEPGSQRSGQRVNSLRRSVSEGYLAKLQKQKQLKERAEYKAYTLKDYKSLQKDIKLGGLGPNYKISEVTAEKMRRQREYSNTIREQNKKIVKDASLVSRHPVDKDNKDMVPRMKALEYARNIPKPKVPSQQKNREVAKEESFTEHAQYLEDLDISQLATLEMLRKRHEEEKQAIAHFRVPQLI